MKLAWLSMVALYALAGLAGCAGKSPSPAPAQPDPPLEAEEPAVDSEVDLLARANELAGQVLRQYNESPAASAVGSPLGVGDYRRTIRSESLDGSPYLIVTYTLKRIMSTEAAPYEFSVIIDQTTGETQILRL